jgi:DNA-binding CsgD family transcriptional regulator
MFWGHHGVVTGAMRSVLLMASRMTCEHLGALNNKHTAAARLSPREEAALRLIATGKSDKEAGQLLGITARTIRFHVDNAKTKLGVTTRAQVVLKMLRGDVP